MYSFTHFYTKYRFDNECFMKIEKFEGKMVYVLYKHNRGYILAKGILTRHPDEKTIKDGSYLDGGVELAYWNLPKEISIDTSVADTIKTIVMITEDEKGAAEEYNIHVDALRKSVRAYLEKQLKKCNLEIKLHESKRLALEATIKRV